MYTHPKMPFIDVSINEQRGVTYKTKLEVEDDDLLKTVARTAIVKFLRGNPNTTAIDGTVSRIVSVTCNESELVDILSSDRASMRSLSSPNTPVYTKASRLYYHQFRRNCHGQRKRRKSNL